MSCPNDALLSPYFIDEETKVTIGTFAGLLLQYIENKRIRIKPGLFW